MISQSRRKARKRSALAMAAILGLTMRAGYAQTGAPQSIGMSSQYPSSQLGNARRYGCDLSKYPTILEIENNCNALPAFADAAPEKQPDAE